MADNNFLLDWAVPIVAAIAATLLFHNVVVVGMFGADGGSIFGSIGSFLVILAAVVIVGGIAFAAGKGEEMENGERQAFKKYGLVPFLTRLRKSPNGFIGFIRKRWTMKDPYFEGELPPVFKDLRAELMMLMNYQTRLHTYFAKRSSVDDAVNKSSGIEANFDTASKTYDDMANALDKYRFAGMSEKENSYGWSNNRNLVMSFFNMLKKDLEGNLKAPVPEGTFEALQSKIISEFAKQLNFMSGSYGQYIINTKRFGLIHRLKSLKITILDLVALYGKYKHYYRFANENAIFEKWTLGADKTPASRDRDWERKVRDVYDRIKSERKNELREEKLQKLRKDLEERYAGDADIDAKIEAELINSESKVDEEVEDEMLVATTKKEFKNKVNGVFQAEYGEPCLIGNLNTSEGRLRHEVDVKGFVLEDVHKVEVENVELPFIRRIKIEDIEDFPGSVPQFATYTYVYPKIEAEWDYLIEDLRFGTFHPRSRSSIDYTKVLSEKRSLNFDKISRTRPDRVQNTAAFDIEALKISGKFVYWGRKNYWDTYIDSKNPYPAISTIGLSRFITEVVRLRAKNNDIADKYLSYWVWDTSRPDEPFTSLLGKEEK